MSWTTGDPKLAIKRAIQNRIPSSFSPILVASMGRSGSTLVYNALVTGMALARFGTTWKPFFDLCHASAFELGETKFAGGVVYKTHAYPSEIRSVRLPKVIFLFSTPSQAALSAIASGARFGDRWTKDHFQHLRADRSHGEIASRDVLRFRDQLDAWLNASNLDVLAVRYESLWDHPDVFTEFAGYPVSLPPRRTRSAYGNLDQRTKDRVMQNYKALDEEFAKLPDFIWTRRSTTNRATERTVEPPDIMEM